MLSMPLLKLNCSYTFPTNLSCSLCVANQTRKFGSHHETAGHGTGTEAMLTSNGNDDEYVMLKDATTTVNDISKSIVT